MFNRRMLIKKRNKKLKDFLTYFSRSLSLSLYLSRYRMSPL
jgi:hypothetical protein